MKCLTFSGSCFSPLFLLMTLSGCAGLGGNRGVFALSTTSRADHVAFGGNWQGMQREERVSLQKAAGISYIRSTVTLPNFTGKDAALDYYAGNGQRVLLNIRAETDEVFARDIPTFKSRLASLLQKYRPEVLVVENEPATAEFYTDDLANYIAELKAAVEVAHAYGVKVSDGALHVECMEPIRTGDFRGGTVCERQKYLIEEYAKIPGLDYVSLHLAVGGDGVGDANGFPKGLLESASSYAFAVTGHEIISNEWHVEIDSVALMEGVVAEFKAANQANGQFRYSIMFSGDGLDKALPFNNGTALNSVGINFRNAVAR